MDAAADGEATVEGVGSPEVGGEARGVAEFGAVVCGGGGASRLVGAVEVRDAAEDEPLGGNAAGYAELGAFDFLANVLRALAGGGVGADDVEVLSAEDGQAGGEAALEEVPLGAELGVARLLGLEAEVVLIGRGGGDGCVPGRARTIVALAPPNAKLLEIATSIDSGRASLGT